MHYVTSDDLRSVIRKVQDFPKKGIVFRDITTLLQDKDALRFVVDSFVDRYRNTQIDAVVGIESRGFIIGAAIAYQLGVGFVPIRKPGKLPALTLREEYALEYGHDAIEIHSDALRKGDSVLIHDDLLATGGTVAAACRLVERLGATIAGISFIIELSFLHGREKLPGYHVTTLVQYDSE